MVDPLFSEADLDQLGEDLAFARPDTCTILRYTEGRDPTGGVTEAWVSVGTTNCRVEVPNRVFTEYELAGRPSPTVYYTIYTDRDASIGPDDRIGHEGHEFEVYGVPGAETFAAELKIQAALVTDQPS